jgi:hypothetical protein
VIALVSIEQFEFVNKNIKFEDGASDKACLFIGWEVLYLIVSRKEDEQGRRLLKTESIHETVDYLNCGCGPVAAADDRL